MDDLSEEFVKACKHGLHKIIRYLINQGFDYSYNDYEGLFLSVRKINSFEIVKLFIDNGFDVNYEGGFILNHMLSGVRSKDIKNHRNKIKLIIESGYNLDYLNARSIPMLFKTYDYGFTKWLIRETDIMTRININDFIKDVYIRNKLKLFYPYLQEFSQESIINELINGWYTFEELSVLVELLEYHSIQNAFNEYIYNYSFSLEGCIDYDPIKLLRLLLSRGAVVDDNLVLESLRFKDHTMFEFLVENSNNGLGEDTKIKCFNEINRIRDMLTGEDGSANELYFVSKEPFRDVLTKHGYYE